jgi:hypothetical protein
LSEAPFVTIFDGLFKFDFVDSRDVKTTFLPGLFLAIKVLFEFENVKVILGEGFAEDIRDFGFFKELECSKATTSGN